MIVLRHAPALSYAAATFNPLAGRLLAELQRLLELFERDGTVATALTLGGGVFRASASG